MLPNEKKIMQEDCSEDKLGPGILTLTNMRIAFDKTEGRIVDFTKKFGDTVMEAKLNQIVEASKEGRFIKKLRVIIKTDEGEKTFKFGVFSNSKWEKKYAKQFQTTRINKEFLQNLFSRIVLQTYFPAWRQLFLRTQVVPPTKSVNHSLQHILLERQKICSCVFCICFEVFLKVFY